MSWKTNWIIFITLLGTACQGRSTLLDAPCPCLDGYTCCESVGICLPSAADCPPPIAGRTCMLEDQPDGSSLIRCSDGTTYPGRPKEMPPMCGGTYDGDLQIDVLADLDVVARYTEISGSLIVDAELLTELELPCLERIGESIFTSRAPVLERISLPALVEANRIDIAYAPQLTEVDLRALTTVHGSLAFNYCDALTTIAPMPNLKRIDGQLSVYHNPLLASLRAFSVTATIGDLSIRENPSLTSLAGLESVRAVRAGVELDRNSSLESIAALGGLGTIGTALTITYNQLRNLHGLENITRILNDCTIYEPQLESLAALAALRDVEEDLSIGLGRFSSLAELTSLQRIGGNLALSPQDDSPGTLETIGIDHPLTIGGLQLYGLSQLRDLEGLDVGAIIQQDVVIENNPALASLAGLRSVTRIQGAFRVLGNGALTSLEGLEALTRVDNDLTIESCNVLTRLEGLQNLTYAREVTIQTNRALEDVEGLRGLAELGTWRPLTISGNNSLATLAGFRNLRPNDFGNLTISENPRLVDLEGLAGLTTAQSLQINRNSGLVSLTGLEGLISADSLTLSDNPRLTDLTALRGLTQLSGMSISENAALHSLLGLEGITTMNYSTVISHNPALTSLAGLDNLREVRNLVIDDNPSLTDLGLGALRSAPYGLTISANLCLPTCTADELRDELESNAGPEFSSSIHGNRDECMCTETGVSCPPGC